MLFTTLAYAKFFAIVFVVSWLLARWRQARLGFLLVASYAFYAGWSWKYLPLIFASSTADYLLALRIEKEEDPRRRKLWLIATAASNLGLLALFKYWNFALDTLREIQGALGGRGPMGALDVDKLALKLALPVGISFYTFESMSYVVDVYRRDMPACRNYLKYLLFVAFFPHLVAGPIVRPKLLLPQFDRLPSLHPTRGSEGLFLVAVGLLKKIVVGDYLAVNLVDRVFDRVTSFSALEVLVGVYGYAFQIYCDFSGYTDIAIGCALLLGIELNKNFASPYRATDLQDFWRRWHVSLSTWLRDYLYIPLGGSKGPAWKTYRNLMITMLLGGLWHGASWTFVFWGFLHGAALVATRAWRRWRGAPGGDAGAPASLAGRVFFRFVTFHYVCFAWIFFRSESFAKARLILKQLGTFTSFAPNLPPKLLAILAVAALTHFIPDSAFDRSKTRFAILPAPVQGACLFGIALVLREAAGAAVVPFVYFQF